MVDIHDVPTGLRALDALIKEAPVELIRTGTVQPGRYLILFGGQVEPVQRSVRKATWVAGDALEDVVFLPWAEERIHPAIREGARRWPCPGDTLGVLQNGTPPTLIRAVDRALKGALVDLVELRVADGLGGKAIATVWGETPDVEAAIELAEEAFARGRGHDATTSIIRRADWEVEQVMAAGSHFFVQEWRG